MSITVRKKVTNITASQWMNRDDTGQEIAGKKNVQVSLEGGYSFRSQEGDENFADICDFIRISSIIEVACSDVIPVPYPSTQTTESGDEVTVTKYFKNLENPVLEDFSDPIRKEKFKDRQVKSDGLVFAHKESTRRGSFGKKTQKPEDNPAGTGDDGVIY